MDTPRIRLDSATSRGDYGLHVCSVSVQESPPIRGVFVSHPELQYEYASPSDPEIDEFTSGDDEVDRYFHSRQWFDDGSGKASPPTYKFCDGDELVGFASVAFSNSPHPTDGSADKAKYLVVYVVGIREELRGVKNPHASDETYARTLFRTLERFGREKEGVVGMSLWVRADNARAIAFYEKVGFEPDPGGPVQRSKEGAPHLTMRKHYSSGGS